LSRRQPADHNTRRTRAGSLALGRLQASPAGLERSGAAELSAALVNRKTPFCKKKRSKDKKWTSTTPQGRPAAARLRKA
jgi:hypothetical protein